MNIVTTGRRGVFFGEIIDRTEDKIILKDAQMCVYWSRDINGIMGLASHGPSRTCRISRPIPKIELFGITAVMDVTREAELNWKECPLAPNRHAGFSIDAESPCE